jgi:hypothetical protein
MSASISFIQRLRVAGFWTEFILWRNRVSERTIQRPTLAKFS